MKIGAVNNFRNDICEEVELIAGEGFDFVDLTLEPHFAHGIDVGKLAGVIESNSIEAIGHTSSFLPVIFPQEKIRAAAIEEIFYYLEIFGSLGIDKVTIHPSLNAPLASRESLIELNREFIRTVNGFCREKGLTLMVETFMKPFNTANTFLELLSDMDDIMVHLDVGHCNVGVENNTTEEFFRLFGSRIAHVHFSDNFGNRDDHIPLGCGSIDWKYIVDILSKNSYDSTITLEIFTADRNYLIESKKFLEDLLTGLA